MRLTKRRLAELYETQKPLLKKLVFKFIARYGGDFEELMTEANWQFLSAVHKFKRRRGRLARYISTRVWGGMLEMRRSKARQSKKKIVSINDATPAVYRQSRFVDLWDELSADARIIVSEVLKPDLDLDLMVASREGMRIVQRALCEYHADWHPDRLYEAFENIEQAVRQTWPTKGVLGLWLDSTHPYR